MIFKTKECFFVNEARELKSYHVRVMSKRHLLDPWSYMGGPTPTKAQAKELIKEIKERRGYTLGRGLLRFLALSTAQPLWLIMWVAAVFWFAAQDPLVETLPTKVLLLVNVVNLAAIWYIKLTD